MADDSFLTDKAKAALSGSGIVSTLRNAVYADKAHEDVHVLEGKAQAIIENLQDLIAGGQLEDADTQRLNAVLSKLRGAMAGGIISRNALATALSEAANAISAAEGNRRSQTAEKQMEQLWHKIGQSNKDIDDDFEKMRSEGIIFDEKQWQKHKELSEYLQTHPRDIEKQKELDVVDDLLLEQAEAQVKKHPKAKPHVEDAKKKSKERHEMVDHDLAAIEKNIADTNISDWEHHTTLDKAPLRDVNLNDVEAQSVGQKPKSPAKNIPF